MAILILPKVDYVICHLNGLSINKTAEFGELKIFIQFNNINSKLLNACYGVR